MTNPWGDPEKIAGAVEFAERLTNSTERIEKELGAELDALEDSEELRKRFFLLIMKIVKREHIAGSRGYEDVGYIINRLLQKEFGSNYRKVKSKFYEDGLFSDINIYWSNL